MSYVRLPYRPPISLVSSNEIYQEWIRRWREIASRHIRDSWYSKLLLQDSHDGIAPVQWLPTRVSYSEVWSFLFLLPRCGSISPNGNALCVFWGFGSTSSLDKDRLNGDTFNTFRSLFSSLNGDTRFIARLDSLVANPKMSVCICIKKEKNRFQIMEEMQYLQKDYYSSWKSSSMSSGISFLAGRADPIVE